MLVRLVLERDAVAGCYFRFQWQPAGDNSNNYHSSDDDDKTMLEIYNNDSVCVRVLLLLVVNGRLFCRALFMFRVWTNLPQNSHKI